MRVRAVYVHVAVYVRILHVHVLPAYVFVFVPVPVPMFERVWLPLVRIHSLRTVLTDRPRTVQLLHKMKIRAAQSSKTLLKVVRNPVSAHLPPGCRKIGTHICFNTSARSCLNEPALCAGTSVQGKLVRADDFVATLPDEPIVFCYGSHAHGPVEVDYVEEVISLSQYPVRAA